MWVLVELKISSSPLLPPDPAERAHSRHVSKKSTEWWLTRSAFLLKTQKSRWKCGVRQSECGQEKNPKQRGRVAFRPESSKFQSHLLVSVQLPIQQRKVLTNPF